MRCPDCQKFVSYDTDTDPEVDGAVDDEGVVAATARIVNCCAECGTELKEATLEIEIDLSADFTEHVEEVNAQRKADGLDPIEHQPEVVDISGSRTERTQTEDRNGRAIKSSRYMRRYYGADVEVTLRCSCGDWEGEGSAGDDVQASGMDEL